jgi:hypothetical protein
LAQLWRRPAANGRRGSGRASAFPSWFLRITCDRCGKLQFINEAHAAAWRDRTLRQILARMRHDGCGGLPGRAELLTAADIASSRCARDGRAAVWLRLQLGNLALGTKTCGIRV